MSLRLSARAAVEAPNELALARQAAGVVNELTDSNPTHHGLTDPAIADVLARSLPAAMSYAPDPKGWRPAREALAARFGGQPDDYWLTASTSEAYSWLMLALGDPGDAVASPMPGYPLIEPLARLASLAVVPYAAYYVHPSGWELDLDSVAAALNDQRVRALVAVSPNNPTGSYVWPAEAGAISELCARAGVPIIADEVFRPYALAVPRPAPPLAQGAGEGAVVITLDGLSKLLAAPQLKLGWLRLSGASQMTNPLAERLDAIADAYLSVNSPVACALPELLELADATVARVRQRCQANLAALESGLSAGCRVRRAEGGWVALVDLPPVSDDDQLGQALLQRGLSAHPGWFYDIADAHVIAVSLLPEPAAFQQMIGRISDASDGTLMAANDFNALVDSLSEPWPLPWLQQAVQQMKPYTKDAS